MDAKPLPLRQIKPKNARVKRYLDNKAPQATENPRTALFLRYTSSSQVVNLVLADLYALRRPLAIKFNKKNNVHPFEDPSSFEFLSDKNDASLMVYGSNSKKRPHCITFVRLFDFKVLDMIELMVDGDSLRSIQQFHNRKPAVGTKPLLSFSGSAFESPTPNAYTLAKSILTDLLKGPDASNVDVEGLQYMINISVDEEQSEEVKPMIRLRCYLLNTKKSGTNLPRVEVEEMGPRIDFRVGRIKEADPDMLKASMKRPKSHEPSTKKNVNTDIIGDKVGRIHLGRQDLSTLQTRKMKGLKRNRDLDDDGGVALPAMEDEIDFSSQPTPEKRIRTDV